jgi:hypothetical protein
VEVLGPRELNRALLARQLLLRRETRPVADVVELLLGLQAQAPMPPYFGLWSRIEGFDPHELGRMITDREVVRIKLMRGTVHLVTVRDALLLRPLVQVVIERGHNVLLGHADRRRIIPADFPWEAMLAHGRFVNNLLVDGMLRATWWIERDTKALAIRPHGELTPAERDAVEVEAAAMAAFAGAAAVRFEPPVAGYPASE